MGAIAVTRLTIRGFIFGLLLYGIDGLALVRVALVGF
jgi:hypothetical protein